VLKTLIDRDIPLNEGFYRSFTVSVPEGTVARAKPPAAVGGGWEVTFRIAETLYPCARASTARSGRGRDEGHHLQRRVRRPAARW